MSDQQNDIPLRLPTITWPRFLLGLMAMIILSAVIVALLICAIPTVVFVAVGVVHPSVLRIHILFAVLLAVGVSFGLNIVFVGSWFFNGLFLSVNRRIIVATLTLLWFAVLLRYALVKPFVETGVTLAVLGRAIWVKAHGSIEQV